MPAQNQRLKNRFLSGLTWDEQFLADVDLSGCQYRFVQCASTPGYVKGATGASLGVPIGVLQNAPTAGQYARVRIAGLTQIKAEPAACTLNVGGFFTSTSIGGACVVASAGGIILGRWMDYTTGSAYTGCALVNCFAPVSACGPSVS